jgi:hypothetical protein
MTTQLISIVFLGGQVILSSPLILSQLLTFLFFFFCFFFFIFLIFFFFFFCFFIPSLTFKFRFAWFGIGYSYSLIGNVAGANYAFKEFLVVWDTADRSLPQVIIALYTFCSSLFAFRFPLLYSLFTFAYFNNRSYTLNSTWIKLLKGRILRHPPATDLLWWWHLTSSLSYWSVSRYAT